MIKEPTLQNIAETGPHLHDGNVNEPDKIV